ncbi:MAG: serine/threonine-protein kinase [Rudaea sp.]|uniref:serine/threonine-protein kinase n=1 Tax=Rudaea sp. TaxID=2136325 RepID=UPI0039E6FD06
MPEAQRSAWLCCACGDDADLQREIEELLHSHLVDSALDTPPQSTVGMAIPPSLIADTRLGVWRIERLVGRGGIGEVYLVRRTGAEFEQHGALKLLRLDAIGELDRFHAERRMLARLEHPHIARLLDGGVAPDGRPYTVMEYIDGRSLIEYCNANKATLRERLALFSQVCDAVTYAHRNLVVHRDLKPANTLVDAQGQVKLLDTAAVPRNRPRVRRRRRISCSASSRPAIRASFRTSRAARSARANCSTSPPIASRRNSPRNPTCRSRCSARSPRFCASSARKTATLRGEALVDRDDALKEREDALRKSADLFARVAADDPAFVTAFTNYGNVFATRMDHARVIALYRQALAVDERLPERNDAEMQTLYGNLDKSCMLDGDFAAAGQAFAEVTQIARRTYGEKNPDYWAPCRRQGANRLPGRRSRTRFATVREFDGAAAADGRVQQRRGRGARKLRCLPRRRRTAAARHSAVGSGAGLVSAARPCIRSRCRACSWRSATPTHAPAAPMTRIAR